MSSFTNNIFVHTKSWPGHPPNGIDWNGYTRSRFVRNIVVFSNGRPTLFEGVTCAQVSATNNQADILILIVSRCPSRTLHAVSA